MEHLPSNVREIDIDEAVALAIDCQRNGRLDDAEALYREILASEPGRPDALHFAGILAHQQGRLDDAAALLRRSLDADPTQAGWFSNLAIVLHARGENGQAIAACERAIALEPGHANAYSNLGALLKAEGRLADAEAAYRRAIGVNPDHAGAWINLGILVSAQGRVREAVSCYCKVITLSPQHPDARRLLALAHSTLGEVHKAAAIYDAWLREDPENPIARHMAAACTGRDVPARASDAFVAATFDGFADSFDERLAHLQYRAPSLVAQVIGEPGEIPSRSLDVLDAGCGTGLCGALVAPWARRLVGVDLSARMLAQARVRQVYDELVQAELTAYLHAQRDTFDVVASADTLVYFGALEEVVSGAAGALRAGGRLVCTLEELIGDEQPDRFALRPHGRYGHAPAYVERVVAAAGLTVEIARAELRMEGGAPVAGLVVRGIKTASGGASCPD